MKYLEHIMETENKINYKKHLGHFIKPCPCSPSKLRCSYHIITPAVGCPFDCSYCFLNFYSKDNNITIYTNIDDMFKELDEFLIARKGLATRIGTGEFMDSLAIEELDKINIKLANTIIADGTAIIEFKTKSKRIEQLLTIPAHKNIVVSWSLNPQSVIDTEEPLTASLKERLDCAKTIAKHGHSLAFHLDPIFMEDELLKEYVDLINKVMESVPASKIRWISMGGFRYTEDLKLCMLEKNGLKKTYLCGEFIRCEDGKFRYPRYKRVKFYNAIGNTIKKHGAVKTYMCMEDSDLWRHIDFDNKKVLSMLHT